MPDKDVYVLGLNAYDHDTSACLLRNGEIVVAINKERLTRLKHDTGFYEETVAYCLQSAGVRLADVDLVVRNSYVLPVDELEQRLVHQDLPDYLSMRERERAFWHPLFRSTAENVVTVSHHLAHAYSAFAASPFEEGVVMIVDGVGSQKAHVTEPIPEGDSASPLAHESESYYRFRGTEIEPIRKVWMEPQPALMNDAFYTMPGLGALYSRVSTYIFKDWNKCGEVMGLAPYGRPDKAPRLLQLKNGRLEILDWPPVLRNPWMGLSDQRWEESRHREQWEDLAWRIQDDTERVLLERARWLHETTGARNLCIAGGVALNCVANGRIVREGPFENVWIQPAAGDDGVAIGCAYYGHLAKLGQKRAFVQRHSYLGKSFGPEDEKEAIRPWQVRLATKRRREPDIARATAKVLAAGQVVGWFQGGSEYGPRALGNRSILADPREARMKDHVNARVKHRQAFRPFAPAVLAERAPEIFEGDHDSPYMLLAQKVRPEWRDKVGAIVHVDGTARVQTVHEETNPRLHALLRAFDELTGVPVLLNTSFNIRGDPIVEAPLDAMDCFLYTGIDVLVIHDLLIRKRWSFRASRPIVQFATEVRRNLRSEAWLESFARRVLDR